MTEFKTPKGTILPLTNLKGRPYLMVSYRLIWFREEHPNWTLETKIVHTDDVYSIAEGIVKDADGRIIANSFKREDAKHFPDHLEKSCTSAVGRALAMVGFGTQFCTQEFDEGDRIVDTPIQPAGKYTTKAEIEKCTSLQELEAVWLRVMKHPQHYSSEELQELVRLKDELKNKFAKK